MKNIPLMSKVSHLFSSAESSGGAYRAEATDQWTAPFGITLKIPPLYDGPTSRFKYEARGSSNRYKLKKQKELMVKLVMCLDKV